MSIDERALPFAERRRVAEVEEGFLLAPKFDELGFISVVTTDVHSGDVLMMGVMNAEALIRTIETREAHYWSRSRECLWHKGATSGFVQNVIELRIDDDQDAVWLRVEVKGEASCHVGYRSCFYRSVSLGETPDPFVKLSFEEKKKLFDPSVIYGDVTNPTRL